jgi:hypothetical protein
VAYLFRCPRSSNHWLSAEASAPVVLVRLNTSFQEKKSKKKEHKKKRKTKRKEQKKTAKDVQIKRGE